jgi:competence protein ComEC
MEVGLASDVPQMQGRGLLAGRHRISLGARALYRGTKAAAARLRADGLRLRALTCIGAWRDAEAGRFRLWLPVCMAAGVMLYFGLRFEPPQWCGAVISIAAAALVVLTKNMARGCSAAVLAFGLGLTSVQLATVRALPLEQALPRRAATVSGLVRTVEELPEGRRITLQDVTLDIAAKPPQRHIRIRLRKDDTTPVSTGEIIKIRALIRPPAWPALPGGWDLQRDAFYAGLGGSGFALGSIEPLDRSSSAPLFLLVQRLREAIARRVTATIPGAAGQIAVTLLTGSQMGIPEPEHQAFRDSGLAHLLAVAGLHIGIVMGLFLGLARTGFALSTHATLHWRTKQLSVCIALIAGGAYMILTGMHVPIMRSFSMACLVAVAIIVGRNPLSLNALGLAAVVLITVAPQEIPGVSFQMSFFAVLALISGYDALRPWLRRLHGKTLSRRLVSHLLALALTSALAGTASAPYGAYHFGRVQLYFIPANMVAVPITALLAMPAGLASLFLMPFGLERLALQPMGWGVEAIIWVAQTTAGWPYATAQVPHMPVWGLIVLSLGLLWIGIWRSPVRMAGLVLVAVGIASAPLTRPADLLLSADARLIGVRTAAGTYIQRGQGGNAFVRDSWLQYWAAPAAQPMPKTGTAASGAISCDGDVCRLRPDPFASAAILIRNEAHPADCRNVTVIVSMEPARRLCPKPWPLVADRFTTWRDGAVAIWLRPDGATMLTDRQDRGQRPWVPVMPTPRAHPPPPSLPLAPIDRPTAETPGRTVGRSND